MPERQVHDPQGIQLPVLDRPVDGGNHVAGLARALAIEHAQRNDVRVGRDALRAALAGDDARQVRAVPEGIAAPRHARHEVDARHDAAAQVGMRRHARVDERNAHQPAGHRADAAQARTHLVGAHGFGGHHRRGRDHIVVGNGGHVGVGRERGELLARGGEHGGAVEALADRHAMAAGDAVELSVGPGHDNRGEARSVLHEVIDVRRETRAMRTCGRELREQDDGDEGECQDADRDDGAMRDRDVGERGFVRGHESQFGAGGCHYPRANIARREPPTRLRSGRNSDNRATRQFGEFPKDPSRGADESSARLLVHPLQQRLEFRPVRPVDWPVVCLRPRCRDAPDAPGDRRRIAPGRLSFFEESNFGTAESRAPAGHALATATGDPPPPPERQRPGRCCAGASASYLVCDPRGPLRTIRTCPCRRTGWPARPRCAPVSPRRHRGDARGGGCPGPTCASSPWSATRAGCRSSRVRSARSSC